MREIPTQAALRAVIGQLDALDRKVLGGLVTLMIHEPTRIRDREWMAERFVQVAVVAHGFDQAGADDATAGVAVIEGYGRLRMGAIVRTALALFVRTAHELEARTGSPTIDDARDVIAGYLA